tara:strand:- start:944 stop:1897 length:954 start_codon:yes stop_codon:yes gene_type:complete
MKDRNLIIILSHCDTEEKLNVLRDTVKVLKDNHFSTLVTSYIPLPEDIVRELDYFIYDKSNPILNWPIKSSLYWRIVPHKGINYKLSYLSKEIGNAALNQAIVAGNFSKTLDYTHFSYINYDVDITSEFLETLKNPKPVQFSSEGITKNFPCFLLSIFDKKNLEKLLTIASCEEYIKGHPNKGISFITVEHYWRHISTFFNYERIEYSVYDKIHSGDWDNFNLNREDDLFHIYYQSNLNNPSSTDLQLHTEDPRIVLYNIVKNITLNVNGKTVEIADTTYVIEDTEISELGYYRDDKYIDLMYIFEVDLISTVTSNG